MKINLHFVQYLTTAWWSVFHATFFSQGNFFQKRTALSVLLSVSTIPESSTGRQNFQPSRAALEPFTSLRSFPRLTHDDVATAQVGRLKSENLLFFPPHRWWAQISNNNSRVGKPWQFPCLLNDDVTAAEVSNSRSSFHYFHASPTIHKAQVSNINLSQIQKALAVFLPNWWWYCYSLG